MATSSITSVHKSFKYDVFLSFSGEDTRKSFVDHLYLALQHKNIYTYKDEERITKGKRIHDELIRSIQDSKFYIIVFSRNYASSSWCLDELVKIMECHNTTEHTAFPIFYDVEPTEVRNQSGAVRDAFLKLEKRETAGKWRKALKEAACLAGWELKNTANGHEAKFIQKIAEEISLELCSINLCYDEKLVGLETRVNDIILSLQIGIDDVRMIGIKGVRGGGKTTLAGAVFDKISHQFEGKSFVEKVREVSKASLSGLNSLQNKVLLDVLKDKDISVTSVHEGINMMKMRMPAKKVLIILDDVDDLEQLEALAGEPNWFKLGSRIIVTARDEQVLLAHRVTLISDVIMLSNKEAICLFSRYAIGRDIPIQGYEKLSEEIIRYAAGLPLSIKVLGSYLCGKDEPEWKYALERLKTTPLSRFLNLDGCFLLEKLHEDFFRLESLQHLSLSYTNIKHLPNSICMLKHLKSLNLCKCSLLMKLPEDLGRLESLQHLSFSYTNIKHLPNSICMLKHLKYLNMIGCLLLEKLPEDLGRLESLQHLSLSYSNIKHIPDSICMLKHLKSLNLDRCVLLDRLPEDLGRLESLQHLSLSYTDIKHLPDGVCMLKHLKSLYLDRCLLFEKLPEDLGRLESLQHLSLSYTSVKHLPDSICMLKHVTSLNLGKCWLLKKLPADLGQLESLKMLCIEGTCISYIPQSIHMLKGLRFFGSRELLQTFGFTFGEEEDGKGEML